MGFHLHVVIDDELKKHLEGHAKKLQHDKRDTLNYSAAVRDLLRAAVGLPRVNEDAGPDWVAPRARRAG
jgi:hypothetical protein